MEQDLFLAAFVGTLAALTVGALALVAAAGWLLHTASSPAEPLRPFAQPVDAAIDAANQQHAAALAAFHAAKAVRTSYSADRPRFAAVSEPRSGPRLSPPELSGPFRPPRCGFCAWLRQRVFHR